MHGLSYAPIAKAIVAQLAAIPPTTDDIGAAIEHLRRAAHTAVPRSFFAPLAGANHADTLTLALTAAGKSAIGAALAVFPDKLPWHYHYTPRPGEADLADRIAFAEVIGPDGPLDAPDCRVGFTLMAPETLYPLHAHPAIELYMVLSGTAQWMTPTSDRMVPQGAFVLHRSNEPHAIRTFATALLALYAWRGAIDVPAFYL